MRRLLGGIALLFVAFGLSSFYDAGLLSASVCVCLGLPLVLFGLVATVPDRGAL
jgi:hypothetical protein